jgi:hypothetical protein
MALELEYPGRDALLALEIVQRAEQLGASRRRDAFGGYR